MILIRILGIFLSAIILGCDATPSSSAKQPSLIMIEEQNRIRREIGIREIQHGWVFSREEFDAEDWQASKTDRTQRKRIFKDKLGKITAEEDYYYGGARYTDDEGTSSEFISVYYDYATQKIRVSYSGTNDSVRTVLKPFETDSKDVNTAMEKVGSVVGKWGLKAR